MEREGSGLNKIVDAYEHTVNYTLDMVPKFYSNGVQFNVTLKNLNYVAGEKQTKNSRFNMGNDKVAVNSDMILTSHEKKLLIICKIMI